MSEVNITDDEYMNRKNFQDKTFCSLNNFEAFVLQALNVLHLENMCILQWVANNKNFYNIKELYNKMFYENVKDKIGIKVDYEKF